MNLNKYRVGQLAIIISIAAISLFCYSLQVIFYLRHSSFYDSVGYYNQLAAVMFANQRDGLFRALLTAADNSTTVFLPWLQGIVLSTMFTPHRWLAILIQFPWILMYALICYRYFTRFSRMDTSYAALISVAMVSFAAIYNYNGGLPDFRMDLLQALFFGSATIFYATIRNSSHYRNWAVLGLIIGAGALARATLPVYVAIYFLPLFLIDFIAFSDKRLKVVLRYLVMTSVSILIVGPFMIKKFDYLIYYYVIMNTDANANLPISLSILHVKFALMGIGPYILLAIVMATAARLYLYCFSLKDFNWLALWAGAAPLVYLVLSGSGLNPFVSLVAVPGLMAFLLSPFVPSSEEAARPRIANMRLRQVVAFGAGAVIVTALFATATQGVYVNTKGVDWWLPWKKGVSEVAKVILKYQGGPDDGVVYSVTYIGAMNLHVIENHLTYEERFEPEGGGCMRRKEAKACALDMPRATPADWDRVAGRTDAEKVSSIADLLNKGADVLVVPSDRAFLNELKINTLRAELKNELWGTGKWEVIRKNIRINEKEYTDVWGRKSGE